MKRLVILCRSLLALAIFATLNVAQAATTVDDEIQHLLQFIASTSCQYERNGDVHTGSEAAVHIRKKYDYFKDKISSAETFISYSATRSASSGKSYRVLCAGKPIQDSDKWLLEELANYRAKAVK